jgi:hypothetical protein
MPRNFDRRVEVMFPVEAEDLRRRIVEEILPVYLQDNRRARILGSDGTYTPASIAEGTPTFRSQTDLLSFSSSRPAPPQSASPPPSSPQLAPVETNGALESEKKRKKERKASLA